MEMITSSRDKHTDSIIVRLVFGIGWHLVNPTTLKLCRLAVQKRMTIKPWWKIGFSTSNFQGSFKVSGIWEEGKTFKKIDEKCLVWEGIYSLPRKLIQPTPSHPQAFEVCYLDSELSHAWQEGQRGCVVWQRAGQGAEGWTWICDWLTPPLMPGISPFSPAGKWGKKPKSRSHREIQMPFTRINKAAFPPLWSLFLCVYLCLFLGL